MKIKKLDPLVLAKAMRRPPDIEVIVETRNAQDIRFLVNLGKNTHEDH